MKTLTRSFPKTLAALEQIFEWLSSFMKGNGVDDEVAYAINLAVEEAFVNMVRHNARSSRDVSLSLSVSGQKLVVVLIDHDVDPFDPTQASDVDVTRPAHQRPIGGLGVFLINELMDDVRYEYNEGISTLTLVKNLESPDV